MFISGDERFMVAARKALDGLWKSRSKLGLVRYFFSPCISVVWVLQELFGIYFLKIHISVLNFFKTKTPKTKMIPQKNIKFKNLKVELLCFFFKVCSFKIFLNTWFELNLS